jgi:hypothetical protein
MVLPATSTHSTLYRAFLVLLDRERGCSFGTAANSISASSSAAFFPLAGGLPATGLLPFVGRFPFTGAFPVVDGLPAAGRFPFVPLAAPFLATPVLLTGGLPGFNAGFAVPIAFGDVPVPLPGGAPPPISRSAALTGVTIPVRNIISWVPILIAEEMTM